MDKETERLQIKKDKARLKELKKRDKDGLLTENETWEYVRLLNENTDRNWKLTEKLQKVSFIFLGLAGALQLVAIVLTILTILKN